MYEPEDIAKAVSQWNHAPLTIGHPYDPLTNEHLSSRDEGVLDRQGVGEIRNPEFNGKLRGEAWIDAERLQQIAPSVMQAINKGQAVEVSTGLYTDNQPAPHGASFNGRPYSFHARNHRPDHMAILPSEKGACSVSDGCGLLVNANPEGHNQYSHGTSVRVKADAKLKKGGVESPHPLAGQTGTVQSQGISKETAAEDKQKGRIRVNLGGKVSLLNLSHVEPHTLEQPKASEPKYKSEGGVDLSNKSSELQVAKGFKTLKENGNREHTKEFLDDVTSKKGASYLHSLAIDHGISIEKNPGGKGTDSASPNTIRDRLLDKVHPTTNQGDDKKDCGGGRWGTRKVTSSVTTNHGESSTGIHALDGECHCGGGCDECKSKRGKATSNSEQFWTNLIANSNPEGRNQYSHGSTGGKCEDWLGAVNEILAHTKRKNHEDFPNRDPKALHGEDASPKQAAVALARSGKGVKNSWFSDCPRDDKGHCKSKDDDGGSLLGDAASGFLQMKWLTSIASLLGNSNPEGHNQYTAGPHAASKRADELTGDARHATWKAGVKGGNNNASRAMTSSLIAISAAEDGNHEDAKNNHLNAADFHGRQAFQHEGKSSEKHDKAKSLHEEAAQAHREAAMLHHDAHEETRNSAWWDRLIANCGGKGSGRPGPCPKGEGNAHLVARAHAAAAAHALAAAATAHSKSGTLKTEAKLKAAHDEYTSKLRASLSADADKRKQGHLTDEGAKTTKPRASKSAASPKGKVSSKKMTDAAADGATHDKGGTSSTKGGGDAGSKTGTTFSQEATKGGGSSETMKGAEKVSTEQKIKNIEKAHDDFVGSVVQQHLAHHGWQDSKGNDVYKDLAQRAKDKESKPGDKALMTHINNDVLEKLRDPSSETHDWLEHTLPRMADAHAATAGGRGLLEPHELAHMARQRKDYSLNTASKQSIWKRLGKMLGLVSNVKRCPECGGKLDEDGDCEECGWEDPTSNSNPEGHNQHTSASAGALHATMTAKELTDSIGHPTSMRAARRAHDNAISAASSKGLTPGSHKEAERQHEKAARLHEERNTSADKLAAQGHREAAMLHHDAHEETRNSNPEGHNQYSGKGGEHGSESVSKSIGSSLKGTPYIASAEAHKQSSDLEEENPHSAGAIGAAHAGNSAKAADLHRKAAEFHEANTTGFSSDAEGHSLAASHHRAAAALHDASSLLKTSKTTKNSVANALPVKGDAAAELEGIQATPDGRGLVRTIQTSTEGVVGMDDALDYSYDDGSKAALGEDDEDMRTEGASEVKVDKGQEGSNTHNLSESFMDPHQASKEAAKASLDTEHEKGFGHAQEALAASGSENSDGAAASHIKAASAHEKQATKERSGDEPQQADQHDQAAAMHRRAASMHAANMTDNERTQAVLNWCNQHGGTTCKSGGKGGSASATGASKNATTASKTADKSGMKKDHKAAAKAHDAAATEHWKKSDEAKAAGNMNLAKQHSSSAQTHEDHAKVHRAKGSKGTNNMNLNRLRKHLTANCSCQEERAALNSLTDTQLAAIAINAKKAMTANDDDDDDDDGSSMEENADDIHSFDGAKGKGGQLQAGGKGTKDEYTDNERITNRGDMKDPAVRAKAFERMVEDGDCDTCDDPEDDKPGTRNQSMDKWLRSMPSKAREVWNKAAEVERDARLQIVRGLVANVADQKARYALGNHLMGLSLNQLQERAQLVQIATPPPQVQNRREPIYLGGGGGGRLLTDNGEGGDDDILSLPTMNWVQIQQEQKQVANGRVS